MTVLVTGGAGYIGSHTCVELLNAGFKVVIADNLSNSKKASIQRIMEITGKAPEFHQVDLLDREKLESLFKTYEFQSVIHFAGFKAVGESVEKPLLYYHNNITGTLILCELMNQYNVRQLVFSSSATVYGDPHTVPILEDFPTSATNPYGRTKLMIEEILKDFYVSDPSWRIGLLRYFNPVGAHESGKMGEDPNGIPNNLMPYIAQVAVGKREKLSVYGNDYPTHDGTGVRDYIHVVDLALGHLKALEKLAKDEGMFTVNLGTGQGYSVLDVVSAFQKASGKDVPYKIVKRRPGDVASCYADPGKARSDLSWVAERDLDMMCRDSWKWQSMNPDGYPD